MILPILLMAAAAAPADGDPTIKLEPAAKTEILRIDAPDSFDVGWRQRTDSQEIIELVQPPETIKDWSQLITLELAFGGAEKNDADSFYAAWRDGMAKACPGTGDVVTHGTVDGMPALKSNVSCPLNPKTGKPENLTFLVVQGKANLMLVQVAFRRARSIGDEALVTRIANSLKVCDARDIAGCEARKAIGFIERGKADTIGR